MFQPTINIRRWLLIFTLAMIGFVVAGSVSGMMGSLIGSLMANLRWSNAKTSTLATAFTAGSLLATPAIGVALDRFGVRLVMICGLVVLCGALLVASHCYLWHTMLAAFGFIGVGFSASSYLPSAVLVTRTMGPRKGVGMGIVMGAVSTGAAVFSCLMPRWLEVKGWRCIVEDIAALAAATLPLVWFILGLKSPPQAQEPVPDSGLIVSTGATHRDLLSLPFILAAAGSVFASIGMLGVYFHVIPLLVEAGLSTHFAGMAFGGTWAASGVGSLLLGIMADRFGARLILAAALSCGAIGTVLLLDVGASAGGLWCVLGFVLMWGISANGFGQLIPAILTERLGSENLGALIGVQLAIAGTTGALAPIVTGALYDSGGTYYIPVAGCAFAVQVAAILILAIDMPGLASPGPQKC